MLSHGRLPETPTNLIREYGRRAAAAAQLFKRTGTYTANSVLGLGGEPSHRGTLVSKVVAILVEGRAHLEALVSLNHVMSQRWQAQIYGGDLGDYRYER